MSSPSLLAACLLLVCSVAMADDAHIGGQCSGDILLNQNASTNSDMEGHYVVAYSGDPGVEISCITTQDLSQDNKTLSTVVSGGPGRRYVVLKVAAKDESDADFAVNIFGTNLLQNRVKRADDDCMDEPLSKDKPPIQAAAEDIGRLSKRLRTIADRLDAVEKLLLIVGNPLGSLSGST